MKHIKTQGWASTTTASRNKLQLHTTTYNIIQLHTTTYNYIQLHTTTYNYIQLHTTTYNSHRFGAITSHAAATQQLCRSRAHHYHISFNSFNIVSSCIHSASTPHSASQAWSLNSQCPLHVSASLVISPPKLRDVLLSETFSIHVAKAS